MVPGEQLNPGAHIPVQEEVGGLVVHHGWIQTIVYGLSGVGINPKILRYNLPRLVHLGGLCTVAQRGTLCTMSWDALQVMFLSGICMILVALLTSYLSRNGMLEWAISSQPSPLDAQLELETLNSYLNRVIPFMLGLYLSLCLQRWWTLREVSLGQIYNGVSNICMMVGAYFPDDRHRPLRDKIRRYASCTIRLLAAAGQGAVADDEDALELMARSKLAGVPRLTEAELDCLRPVAPYHRVMMVLAWILSMVVHAASLDGVAPPNVNAFHVQLVSARDGVNTVDTLLNTQLPFAYVHLIALLVNVNNIFVVLKCGYFFALAMEGGINQIFVMVSQILYVMVIPVLYHGLLAISYLIEDPYGDEILDFPCAALCEHIEASLTGLDPACHPPVLLSMGLDDHGPRGRNLTWWKSIFDAMQYGHGPLTQEQKATESLDLVFGETLHEILANAQDCSLRVAAAVEQYRSDPAGHTLALQRLIKEQTELYRELHAYRALQVHPRPPDPEDLQPQGTTMASLRGLMDWSQS